MGQRSFCERLESVRFQPWKGEHYKIGEGLLVLGMSHYAKPGWGVRDSNKTEAVIKEQIEGKRRKFFSNIVTISKGHRPSDTECREFWRSVAFYNYIQETVGKSPRQRHPYKLWSSSEGAFAEVLRCLKPRLVLVIGISNWENISNLGGYEGPRLEQAPDQRYAKTRVYPTGAGKRALAFHVRHTSTGCDFTKFNQLYKKALKAACEVC